MQAMKNIQEQLEGHHQNSPHPAKLIMNPRQSSELLNDGFLIKKHIELKHGKTQKLSHVHDSKNAIEYYRYNGFKGGVYFILDAFLYWENLFTMLFIVFHGIAQKNIELTMYYPIVILIVNLITSAIVNFIIDLKLKHACRIINNKEVSKFIIYKKSKAFETRTWASLQPGDIIKIREDEEFPADVLILDVISQANDHKCFVRGGFRDDYSFPSMKRSCEGTQNKTPGIKIPPTQFVDQISGLVKYEYNFNGFFSGSYKLNNNPAAFNLTSDNVAVRGSYLCQTKSVMCLILNVGTQCMGSIFKGADTKNDFNTMYRLSLLRSKKSFDKIYNPMRILQICLILLSILIAFIVEFQIKFQANTSYHKFLEKIVFQFSDKGKEQQYAIFIKDILAFCSGLFACLPLSYKLIMDIIVLVHSNFAEWDYNTIPSGLKFNQGITMKALGNVNNIFISKSAIMNHNVKKVKVVQIKRQQYFDVEQDNNQQNMNQTSNTQRSPVERRDSMTHNMNGNQGFKNYQYPQQYPYKRQADEISTNSYYEQVNPLNPNTLQNDEDENLETLDDYLPNTFAFNPTFANFTLNNDLTYSNQMREPIKEMMKGLTMCHRAQKRREPSTYSQSFYKSIYANEQAQLMLAHSYGFEFIARKNKTVSINCQGTKERYDVIVVDTFQHLGQHLTVIVIKPYQTFSSGSTIYVKGPLSSLFEFIQEDGNSKLQYLNDLKKYAQMGVLPIMIAKKHLTNDETHELESRINEAMSLVKDQDEKIEISLLQYMADLNPLGIIGIQEIFNVRDSLTVQDLLKNGVRVWFLSKDDEAVQVINCNAMKLLFHNSNPLVINGTTEKEVEDQIKSCLKVFTQDKDQNTKGNSGQKLSSSSINTETKSTRSISNKGKEESKPDQRVMIISGESLKYIFRDESMLKCFLTIATFSDFIIGCSITGDQKTDLMKYIKQFNQNGGYSVAVIGSSEDQNLILEADISIALKFRYQQSDTLITSDIVIRNLYSITYLLFKHGTLCHRRLHQTSLIFLYRTFFLGIIFLYFMCTNIFSAVLPFKQLMLLMFTVAVSTIQILLYGISYRDVGYDYFFRIFGEYKRNFTISIFNAYDLLQYLVLAAFDASLMFLISWQKDYLKLSDGKLLNSDGFQLYYGLCLYIIFTFQLTNQNEIVKTFHFLFGILNIIGILFMLDDENLIGIRCMIACPSALFFLVFVILVCIIRNCAFDVFRKKILPWSRKRFEFYTDVEDRLYLEEYEDPYQEFCLEQCKIDYADIQKKLSQKKITMINQNLMKLQRSDSMDMIIEKLNENYSTSQNKKIQDQTILNWFSLKFNDQNKEIEYVDIRIKEKIEKYRKVLFLVMCFNLVQLVKEIILSSLDYTSFESFYFYLGYLLIVIIMYFVTYKFQSRIQFANLIFVIILGLFYSFCYYYMELIEFSLFLNIVVFIFTIMGTYIRIYTSLAISLYILDVNLVNAYFNNNTSSKNILKEENNSQIVIPYVAVLWFVFILMWGIHSYWEERNRKLEFWFRLKKLKEFAKLKQILYILLPAFVRERVNQGLRYIADDQDEVTILFCDISDFDNIVQMFNGRELCEWLDHIYNAFDQLCEQHGLQKVETVGKTYMACGGLKQQEKKFDQRLVNKHHSERVTEFAFNIQKFVNTQHLKDGSQVKVKIGIHSGFVISGVVGENKPQFSLIGDTVNKTSRVCGSCAAGRILMSKETHRLLEASSQMFYYEKISVFFKGIGQEDAFYVHKKRAHGSLKLHYRKDQIKQQRDRSPSLQPGGNTKFEIKNNKVAPLQKKESPQNQEPLETSRSLIQSDKSDNIDPLELLNKSSDSEHFGDDDSFTGDHIYQKFEEKDDKQIFKNPVENSKYNLVERPNYLLQFSNTTHQTVLEDQFRFENVTKNKWIKIFFLLAFAVFNKVELIFFGFQFNNSNGKNIFLYVYTPILVIMEILLFLRFRYVKIQSINFTSKFFTLYFLFVILSITLQCYRVSHDSRLIQIYVMEIMVTVSVIYFFGIQQLRSIIMLYVLAFLVWIIVICAKWDNLTVKSFSLLFELLYFIILHIYCFHGKEMLKRKLHNYEKILDIEIKRTNDLLSNLVPPPVLLGIKNDQKVVDELVDVTLLFTDMVKFTDFSKNVKSPKEVVKLLSELFTRFDQLCVSNKVYKVHTIGDCYVILGYNGHIAQSERTPQIKAQEAWNVIKTGFEMIEIIQDVRENSDNVDLKELNMRIGIHTGRIVAGIIGTKIVRYDIFGADVLIANKMESNGIPGQVVVSEDTKKILAGMPELLETLEFQHHKIIEFEAINKQADSYIVQPKLAYQDEYGSSISEGGSQGDYEEEYGEGDSDSVDGNDIQQEQIKKSNSQTHPQSSSHAPSPLGLNGIQPQKSSSNNLEDIEEEIKEEQD